MEDSQKYQLLKKMFENRNISLSENLHIHIHDIIIEDNIYMTKAFIFHISIIMPHDSVMIDSNTYPYSNLLKNMIETLFDKVKEKMVMELYNRIHLYFSGVFNPFIISCCNASPDNFYYI